METQPIDATLKSTINTLETQLEECDFVGDQQEYFIERFNGETHKVTHKINLNNRPPLFITPSLHSDQQSAIVLRHDVDATVWIPDSTNTVDWQLRHEGTLNAFGYVLASKVQKHFTVCSPDISYGVITEFKRHVFVYKNNYDTAGGLRNRSGQKFAFGQQNLVTMDDGDGSVLGIIAENNVTLILTENFIICLQINTE